MLRAKSARGLAWSVSVPILIGFVCGCGRTPEGLMIQPRTELSTILVSEALAVEDAKSAVRCPTKVVNRGKAVSIRLEATACSCYGVYYNGKKLTGETPVEIPSGESVLTIQASMPTGQTAKSYQARFAVPGADGQSQSVDVQCALQVLNDISVDPRTWSFSVSPENVGQLQRETATITLHYRSETAEDIKPRFPQIPDCLRIANLELTTPSEEIEPGLWRCQWTADLEATVPEDANPDDIPFPVQILMQRNGQQQQAFAQLITRVKLPISYARKVQLGRLYLGETSHRRMQVNSPVEAKFRLQPKQSFDHVNIQVDDELASRHWVEISATPTELGDFQQTVTFATGLDEQPEIQINVVGRVVARKPSGDSNPN